MNNRTFISVDIETDGPIPGTNSMLALGAAAYDANGVLIGKFYSNITPIPGATQDPETMQWWATQSEAWAGLMTPAPEDPQTVMNSFRRWRSQYKRTILCAFPASFDLYWLDWYNAHFSGIPWSYATLDMKTLAFVAGGFDWNKTSKAHWPTHWFDPTLIHTHNALDDAIEQGFSLFAILKELNYNGA